MIRQAVLALLVLALFVGPFHPFACAPSVSERAQGPFLFPGTPELFPAPFPGRGPLDIDDDAGTVLKIK